MTVQYPRLVLTVLATWRRDVGGHHPPRRRIYWEKEINILKRYKKNSKKLTWSPHAAVVFIFYTPAVKVVSQANIFHKAQWKIKNAMCTALIKESTVSIMASSDIYAPRDKTKHSSVGKEMLQPGSLVHIHTAVYTLIVTVQYPRLVLTV